MQNKEIHYKYVISYLVATIILIVALAYYDVPNLVDKFSFALTLSSLLLAILAIFYTIISAHKQDSQFSKIIEATSTLNSSVHDIDKAASSIARLTEDIPQHFQSINTKIDGIQDTYKALTDTEKNAELKDSGEIDSESRKLKPLIARLQFSGMAVLYFFVKASYKSKCMDYSDFDEFDMASLDYALGILNGFEVTELIDFKLHKKSIVPTYCDNLLYDELRKELDRVIQVIDEKQSKKLSHALEWVDRKFA